MSATTQKRDGKSAGGGENGFTTAGQRRLKYGTNVLIMCLAALIIVVFLNVISFRKHWRRDMAVVGVYQPSERTKRIVDTLKEPITLTSVYTGREEENSRDKYFPSVQDFLQELELYAPAKVKVENIDTDAGKAELLARIQVKYSGQAKEYRSLVADFGKFAAEANAPQGPTATQPAFRQRLMELSAVLGGEDSYLASFPQVADLQAKMTKNLQALTDAQDEVKRLTKATGMPRYTEARDKINQTLDQLKETLTAGQKDLQAIASVAGAGTDEFFKTAPDRMKRMIEMVQAIQATVGDVKDANLPADPKAALQAYAKETQKASIWLNEEASRQEDLAKKYPAIAETPNWLARIRTGIIEQVVPLPALVRQVADEQKSLREQIRQVLQMTNLPEDRVANVIRQVRSITAQQIQITNAVSAQISRLGENLTKADPSSQAILEQAKAGQWQAGLVGRIDALKAQITRLPELKLSEVSDKLDSPNTIVAETPDKVQVLSFDDVWPQSEPLRGMTPSETPRRVFNGDTAITNAILSLSQPAVATVIFVHYLGEVPPQMRQYMPPQTGPIPYEQLNTLRQMLTKANFVVKEWNLAKEPNAPEPDKGTQAVYVFLPPPEDQPMPGPQNKEKFGDVHLAKVKDILDKGGRGLFLCKWQPPTRAAFFMPPTEPTYAYEKLLQDKYGVDVLFKYRTVYGIPEQRQPGYYGVNVQRWGYMPLNDFSDMAIGRPLQGRRVLMLDVCPVIKAARTPDGMKIDTILTVPARDEYWAAADVMRLVQQVVSDQQHGGLVAKQPGDKLSPYSVAVAVSNSKNEPAAVILGTGGAVLEGYLSERVPRIGGKNDRLSFDPPPTANADLVINSVLWLAGRADLIGAGPVIMPPVRRIPEGQMAAIRGVVWVLLPALVLVAGGAVFVVRRR
jgi:ElaB/YqjD/DUF883 family membrane-anchored ribosome-binding protein